MTQDTKKPRKSETRKRNHVKSLRLDDQELSTFLKNAQEAGMSPGDYFRMKCCGTTPRRSKKIEGQVDEKIFVSMMGQLGKWGSNLNQIAKAINKAMVLKQAGTVAAILDKKSADIESLRQTVTECYLFMSQILTHVPERQHD